MGRHGLSISLFAILACTVSAANWKTTEEICDANKVCLWFNTSGISGLPSGLCRFSEEAAIGFFASACPTVAGYGASVMNITLAEAQAIVAVSQAGDVTCGALLFAAFAALIVLGV